MRTDRNDVDYFSFVDATPSRPDQVYRGITAPEADFIRRHRIIKSNEAYCVRGEGTCFSDDIASAVSYVNFGRDNPGRTGRANYVLEVRRRTADIAVDRRDGYPKSRAGVPVSAVRRVWKFHPDGSVEEFSGRNFFGE